MLLQMDWSAHTDKITLSMYLPNTPPLTEFSFSQIGYLTKAKELSK